MDINTELSCRRTMDPDMALSATVQSLMVVGVKDINTDLAAVGPQTQTWPSGQTLGLEVMAPGVCAGLPNLYDPGGSMNLGQKHGRRWWTRTQETPGPLVVLGSSPGWDITMITDGKRGTHISPFLTTFISSGMPLSTEHEPFYPTLSPIPYR